MKAQKKKRSTPKVSIVLLTRNSAQTLKGVLAGIVKQKFNDYEIILIDSSSEDNTLKIAKNYPCKIVKIKPENFGHGKTRNYAATLSRGEFIVFLTHDSVPRGDTWLQEILEPFQDKSVVGVYGRQIPRSDENILDKYFQLSLYGQKKIIWKSKNWQQGDNLFSDANSALRKSTLLKHPYADEIIVSEDYEWAIRVLELDYKIVYSPTAQVTHSHSYNLRTLFKRNFDVGVSYKSIYKKGTSNELLGKGLQIMLAEIKQLTKSGHILLVPLAITRDATRFIAIQMGKHQQLLPRHLKKHHLSAQSWYWK